MVYGIRDQRFFGDQGSGFDMEYGIMDQRFLDEGSGFDMEYGIMDQHFFGIRDQDFNFGIGITATQNVRDQGSE